MHNNDAVKVYLHEMGKVQPLTRQQEMECVRHIRAQDAQADEARKDLVEANLALVVSIAQQHPSDHIQILDLIIIGNNGLMTAVRAFADSNAENFPTFAATYIERAIDHAVTTQSC